MVWPKHSKLVFATFFACINLKKFNWPKWFFNSRNSDDDESNSYELESVEQALGNLQVFDAHNANMSPVQGIHNETIK